MSNGSEPAFASAAMDGGTGFHQQGLSKRELISAMCLQGFLSNGGARLNYSSNNSDEECKDNHKVCKISVALADALLAALQEKDE